jgi:hypothetical protein
MRIIRLVWLLTMLLPLAGPVQAGRPFDNLTGDRLEPCPNGFNGLLPNCSIVAVMTTDGKIKACYCNRGNIKPYGSADEVIPPANQEEVLLSPLEAGKVIDKTKPADPCNWLKINGQRTWVCW